MISLKEYAEPLYITHYIYLADLFKKSWLSSGKYGVMKPHPQCGKFSRKHSPMTC